MSGEGMGYDIEFTQKLQFLFVFRKKNGLVHHKESVTGRIEECIGSESAAEGVVQCRRTPNAAVRCGRISCKDGSLEMIIRWYGRGGVYKQGTNVISKS